MLERERLDAVLLNAQHNFAWLTGGSSNGIDSSRENGAASLLITRQGKRYILANNIELTRMLTEEVSDKDFEPIDFHWEDEKARSDLQFQKARALVGAQAVIAADLSLFREAQPIENKIAVCRFRLTRTEVERFKTLGMDAGTALGRAIGNLNAGDTELEIAEKMRHELARGDMTSVVTLVAADERISRFRHPVPTGNRWEKILLLVTCAKRHGLIASLSRMVCIGRIPDELMNKTEAAANVNATLLNTTRPGTSGAELYRAAAEAYLSQGFAGEINRHHQGGATGYRTRDWVAHPRCPEVVHGEQAFAWNPSITGTKVEETYIVRENHVETITASPKFPKIMTVIRGREYCSPGILSL